MSGTLGNITITPIQTVAGIYNIATTAPDPSPSTPGGAEFVDTLVDKTSETLTEFASKNPAAAPLAVGAAYAAQQLAVEKYINAIQQAGVAGPDLQTAVDTSFDVVTSEMRLAQTVLAADPATAEIATALKVGGEILGGIKTGADFTVGAINGTLVQEVQNAVAKIKTGIDTAESEVGSAYQSAVGAIDDTLNGLFSGLNSLVNTGTEPAGAGTATDPFATAGKQLSIPVTIIYDDTDDTTKLDATQTLTNDTSVLLGTGGVASVTTTIPSNNTSGAGTTILDASNGTSLVQVFSADGSTTTTTYSGPDGTGTPTVADEESANGTSVLTTTSSDGSSTATTYSGPGGSGSKTSIDQENSNGTSAITVFDPSGNAITVAFSGPNGSGTQGAATITIGTTAGNQTIFAVGSLAYAFPTIRFSEFGSSASQTGSIPVSVTTGTETAGLPNTVGLFSVGQYTGTGSPPQVSFGPGTYQAGAPGSLYVGELRSPASGSFQSAVPITFSSSSGSITFNLQESGVVYTAADASIPTTIDFGNLHVGQSKTVNVQIANMATGSLTDTLNVGPLSFVTSSGDLSLKSGTLTGIAAGQSGTLAVTATAVQPISVATDVAEVSLTSHDSVLPDSTTQSNFARITSNVMAYAAPAFLVGEGVSPLQAEANNATFNMGTITQGSVAPSVSLFLKNAASVTISNTSNSDVLDGSYVASGSGFTIVGLTSGSFTGITGLSSTSLLSLIPDLTRLGQHSETITVHSTSDDSFSSTALADETITITANVVAATSSGSTTTSTGGTATGSGTAGGSTTGSGTGTSGSGSGTGPSTGGSGTSGTGAVTTTGNAITVTGSGNTAAVAAGMTATTGSGGNIVNVSSTGTVISNGPDTIHGGTGATTVTTLGNGATVIGGSGALAVTGGAGNNTVFAGSGGLTYLGGTGTDTVIGLGKPVLATGGTGGGEFFGGGNATITAGAGGSLNVEVGGNGDQLNAAGPSGVLFGTVGGDMLMSSLNDTGSNVFFGANGTGKMTFITGSGNDLLALGQGTNTVTLGSGHDVIFGNGGTTSVSTITAGAGSLDLAFSGASTNLIIASGGARAFNLYAYVAGADKITLQGYAATQAATAIANQKNINGGTQLSLADGSVVSLIGVAHATASLFG